MTNVWKTPIGQDCMSLDHTLCSWLGERLLFLSEHSNSWNPTYWDTMEDYKKTLYLQGMALKDYDPDNVGAMVAARAAVRWTATYLETLWD